MLSKEEFQKELVRMWDSIRDDNSLYKGYDNCKGVDCKECPVYSHCKSIKAVYDAFEMIETVEKWGKEHPIITNRDKFREIFGFEISHNGYDCLAIPCPDEFKAEASLCNSCPYNGFWNREYKEPQESEEE